MVVHFSGKFRNILEVVTFVWIKQYAVHNFYREEEFIVNKFKTE